MSGCCGNDTNFDGVSDEYKRRLWIVIAINAVMFVVEMVSGHLAKSQALQADALDFLGDTLTYGLSLAVIGASVQIRTRAALAKSYSLLLMGTWVLGSTIHRVFYSEVPTADVMGVVAVLALIANLASVLILVKFKDGDANVRSVWLCSRNDAIGNVAVIFAAVAVAFTGYAWPDLLVAGIMASLFLSSAVQIMKQALYESKKAEQHSPLGH